jgi:hypothetical protein
MLEVLMEWKEECQLWIMKDPRDGTFLQELRDCSRVQFLYKTLDKKKPKVYVISATEKVV